MSTKSPSAYGVYAAWRFVLRGTEEPIVYHQPAPQLYNPIDQVAPFVISALLVPRPTTVNALVHEPVLLPVPGTKGMAGPRYGSIEQYRTESLLDKGPPINVINDIATLMWVYWDDMKYGPYTSRRRPGLGSATRPAGAAFVWDVVDEPGAPLVGFTAYDAVGQPSPWLTIRPCPPDEFLTALRVEDAISALAGL